MAPLNEKRYYFLDGLRGWAALGVVFWHVFVQAYPVSEASLDYLRVFLPINGNFAVELFFVISGFALSVFFLKKNDRRILARIAAGRYLRLVIPIFAACLLVHLAMIGGVIPPAGSRPGAYNDFLRFTPTASHLIRFSFYEVFTHAPWDRSYIVPLWTMSYEFIGSLIVIALLALFSSFPRIRRIVCALTAVTLMHAGSFYCLFIAGMLIADVFLHCDLSRKRYQPLFWIAFLLGWSAPLITNNGWLTSAFLAMVIGFFASIAWLKPVRIFFETSFSLFLGRISFPLYLVHAIILWTFSLWFSGVTASLPLDTGIRNLLTGVATIILSVVAAVAFMPVNTLAVIVSRQFGTWFVDRFEALFELIKKNRASRFPDKKIS